MAPVAPLANNVWAMVHFEMAGGREFFIFLFALGLVLFNWPFLTIFHGGISYYMFALWGGFILAIALVAARIAAKGPGG